MNGDEFGLFVCMSRPIPSNRRPGLSSSNEGTKMNGDGFELGNRRSYLHVSRPYFAVCRSKMSSQSFCI